MTLDLGFESLYSGQVQRKEEEGEGHSSQRECYEHRNLREDVKGDDSRNNLKYHAKILDCIIIFFFFFK